MEKTIAIVMGASVLLIGALTVSLMGANSVGDVGDSADDVSTSQKCQYQEQKIEEGEMDAEDADPACDFDPDIQNQVLEDEFEDVLVS